MTAQSRHIDVAPSRGQRPIPDGLFQVDSIPPKLLFETPNPHLRRRKTITRPTRPLPSIWKENREYIAPIHFSDLLEYALDSRFHPTRRKVPGSIHLPFGHQKRHRTRGQPASGPRQISPSTRHSSPNLESRILNLTNTIILPSIAPKYSQPRHSPPRVAPSLLLTDSRVPVPLLLQLLHAPIS